MTCKFKSLFLSALAALSFTLQAYETPPELRYPYVSTYYVEPVVTPDSNTVIRFSATDWNHSLVRFGDSSHRFDAYLKYSTNRTDWTELSLLDIPSGDHEFNLGRLPSGDYNVGVRVVEKGTGLPSHTVWHEFKCRTADSLVIPASETYMMTAADLATYSITPESDRYRINLVNLTDAEMAVAKTNAAEYGNAVARAAAGASPSSGTYEIFTPAYTNKLIYRGWKYSKVVYAPDYDFGAVENEATNNVLGIQRLISHCKDNGFRKLVMLPNVYRISGYLKIEIPSDFTLDLNGATLKENGFTGSSAAMVRFTHAHNASLVNGTLEGDYYEHDYAGSPNNSEWALGVVLDGDCRYTTVENLTINNITGYGISNGTKAYDHTFAGQSGLVFSGSNNFTRATLNLADGTLDTSVTNQYTSAFRDISKFTNGYISVSKYLGYQGISTKSWYFKAAFYDSEKQYIGGEVAFQYRVILIPAGARYMRISIEAESDSEVQNCGLSGQLFKLPWNCTYRNLNIFRSRCVGMAPSAMKNMLIEKNEFSFCGDSAATCAFDAEDGWDMMQDVTIRENYFHDNVNAELLTCAGHNFVIEKNRGNIHLYSRTNSPIVRDNTCDKASFYCDGSRNRTMHGRYENNKYRTSLVFGGSNIDINWFIATSDPIKSYERGKEFSFSPSLTGRIRDTVVENTAMSQGIGFFDSVSFTNCHFVMTSAKWDFTGCKIYGTYIQHCNKTNSLNNCTIEKCSLSIMNGGTLAITNSVIRNFHVDTSYWSKPNTLLFDNVTVLNTNTFWRTAAYSIGNFDIRNSNFQTGGKPVFHIYDLRAQDTDSLTGTVTIANSFFSQGGAFSVGNSTSTKRIEFTSDHNKVFGEYITTELFISPLPARWPLTMLPGEGDTPDGGDIEDPREFVRGSLMGGPLYSTSLDLENYPAEILQKLYQAPFVATNRVLNAGIWQEANTPVWTKNRTWVFWGQMWFDGGVYRFGSSWLDTLAVKIDGETVYRPANNP